MASSWFSLSETLQTASIEPRFMGLKGSLEYTHWIDMQGAGSPRAGSKEREPIEGLAQAMQTRGVSRARRQSYRAD